MNPFWFSLWDFPGLGDLRPQLRGPVNTIVVIQPDCDYKLARNTLFASDAGVFNAAKEAGEFEQVVYERLQALPVLPSD